ncbi:MAG TPA: hypothetical protein VF637_04215 [Sphingomicrobium sp.]
MTTTILDEVLPLVATCSPDMASIVARLSFVASAPVRALRLSHT